MSSPIEGKAQPNHRVLLEPGRIGAVRCVPSRGVIENALLSHRLKTFHE